MALLQSINETVQKLQSMARAERKQGEAAPEMEDMVMMAEILNARVGGVTMSDEINKVHEAIEADLAAERAANQKSMIIGGVAALLVGGYLAFLHGQISRFLEPEELALAASGAAVDAAPDVEASCACWWSMARRTLRGSLELRRGHPDVSGDLEDEMKPVVDEVSSVLATTAVTRMLASEGDAAASPREPRAAEAVVAGWTWCLRKR